MSVLYTEDGEINPKFKKIVGEPSVGQCFGIFSSQIKGCIIEEAVFTNAHIFGFEEDTCVIFTESNRPLILKYLGEGLCEEISSKVIVNMQCDDFDYFDFAHVDENGNLKHFISHPLVFYKYDHNESREICDDDIAIYELNEEFLKHYNEINDDLSLVADEIRKKELKARKNILEQCKSKNLRITDDNPTLK